MNTSYFEQTQLMLRFLPFVAEETRFALKGGTAINFFHLSMPRLSVDIDLTYLPILPREETLRDIHYILEKISGTIQGVYPEYVIRKSVLRGTSHLFKLSIYDGRYQVKIEPNLILRGTVFPVMQKHLCQNAVREFEQKVTMNVLAAPDLYAGKLCAALDRQHPRDLFDVKLLLENEGLTEEIRKAFVVYLACHNRPMAELLQPNMVAFKDTFEVEFQGMAIQPVSYDELLSTRQQLVTLIRRSLMAEEREFLLSVKRGEPQWNLMGLPGIDRLPALQWKVRNILAMGEDKRRVAYDRLSRVLAGGVDK